MRVATGSEAGNIKFPTRTGAEAHMLFTPVNRAGGPSKKIILRQNATPPGNGLGLESFEPETSDLEFTTEGLRAKTYPLPAARNLTKILGCLLWLKLF